MLCCSISPSLLYTIFSITFHFEWMCKKIGKEDWRNLLNLSTTYFSKTFVLMSFQFSIQPPNITGIMDEGWFNNYVMQWWHPLVWEKIMVGLCLCWDRGGWWGKRLCIMVFWTMLLRMPLQPRGNIPIAANITFLEDSLGHYNKTSNISISRFLIKV